MKKPLNFAILKHFTTVEEACATDVMKALQGQYGNFKAFTKDAVSEALLTAETNGMLQETRYEMTEDGDLKVYYRAHAEGRDTINKYIPD